MKWKVVLLTVGAVTAAVAVVVLRAPQADTRTNRRRQRANDRANRLYGGVYGSCSPGPRRPILQSLFDPSPTGVLSPH